MAKGIPNLSDHPPIRRGMLGSSRLRDEVFPWVRALAGSKEQMATAQRGKKVNAGHPGLSARTGAVPAGFRRAAE